MPTLLTIFLFPKSKFKPGPSREVEFCLTESYSFRAGLSIKAYNVESNESSN